MADLSWLTAQPIAHRGYHDLNKTVWENTLSAFSLAVERGYAIECDVHLSSDGVPIVFHDHSLERLAGQDGYIWQRTAAELAALSIGGTADHAPSLRELLDLVGGRVPLVIELKGTPGRDEGLVERVCETLRAYPGKAAIMSFDHWLIRQFPAHAGDIPTGLTAYGTRDQDIEAHFSMLAHGISFVSYHVADLPNRFVGFVRENLNMPVITWTVRDQASVKATFAHADQMTFEGFEPQARLTA
ncbi:glycerophosphodiester phosphodiesterase [Pseudaminobacter arsenicus]|uniref:Glycerophosphodiester phosphodiesterase n=1 Tax=Borborobacter arsenicus TaxID=1851146 RepID=A0A432VB41_9HYPH|nr:glycerophosphodiester phosphodiesterase [Pseudaminobacter arsenicus]RUM99392.1 glycerophosphodiester phosphodiesterase [Pseudaminobacter arsenicus]